MRNTSLAVAITACFYLACGGDVERENDDLIVPIPTPCEESATIWVNTNAGGTVTCNLDEDWEGSFVTSGVITMPLCDDTLEAFVVLNDPDPSDRVTFTSDMELVFERLTFSDRGSSYEIEPHVFEADAPVVVTIAIPSL